jgi:uncharacterized membrane-anchored protein
MKTFRFFVFALLTGTLSIVQAAAPSDDQVREMKSLLGGLKYQQGEITLKDGLAKLRLPDSLRYLGPQDAETVLVKLWGNPPNQAKPLGLLIPAGMSPAQDNAWAVIIQYEESGYVKDDDAAKINYNDLLKQMKESAVEANKERAKAGYSTVELIGWAAPPRYDAQAKKMYWAKELKFGDGDQNTLNYNIRILGRRGVLVLNAVAGITQLAEIQQAAPGILRAVEFQEGHRYADFKPGSDKVATYGLAALVAGGVLAKTGFFKMLLVGLLAAKKFVVIGVIAVVSFLKKIFGRKSETIG